MITISDAWQAGIDAVVSDNTINRSDFSIAIRTVLIQRFSPAEAVAWIDAVAAEFNRLGQINNPTYNNLRGNIINDPALHRLVFDALTGITGLPETSPALEAAQLIGLRSDRDNIMAAIDRVQEIIDNEPAGATRSLVREAIRPGKGLLNQHRQSIRDAIQGLIGDPEG